MSVLIPVLVRLGVGHGSAKYSAIEISLEPSISFTCNTLASFRSVQPWNDRHFWHIGADTLIPLLVHHRRILGVMALPSVVNGQSSQPPVSGSAHIGKVSSTSTHPRRPSGSDTEVCCRNSYRWVSAHFLHSVASF